MDELLYEPNNVFGYSYNRWRETRVNKLVSLFTREWFNGKRVLELACAHGNIGLYLKALGADVTFADARQQHLDVVLSKDPTAKTIIIDQDTLWKINQQFDMIIHFGVLYHVNNWQQDLSCCLEHTSLLVLESAVANTSKEFEVKVTEEFEGGQNAFNAIGTMCSSTSIEQYLKSLDCSIVRHDDQSLNTNRYIYDWTALDNVIDIDSVTDFENPKLYGGRRFWVVRKLSSSDQ